MSRVGWGVVVHMCGGVLVVLMWGGRVCVCSAYVWRVEGVCVYIVVYHVVFSPPHVARIETEKLLIKLVDNELNARKVMEE